mgnify:CR=1 FL=1
MCKTQRAPTSSQRPAIWEGDAPDVLMEAAGLMEMGPTVWLETVSSEPYVPPEGGSAPSAAVSYYMAKFGASVAQYEFFD